MVKRDKTLEYCLKSRNSYDWSRTVFFIGNSIYESCSSFLSGNQWYFQIHYCYHSISFYSVHFLSRMAILLMPGWHPNADKNRRSKLHNKGLKSIVGICQIWGYHFLPRIVLIGPNYFSNFLQFFFVTDHQHNERVFVPD